MLKKIINLGAVYYTVISGILLLISWMLEIENYILEPSKFLFILLFSFVMSVGSGVRDHEAFGKTISTVFHIVCYIGGFLFCILLPYGADFAPSVIALFIFSAGYAIICIVKAVLVKRTPRNKKAKSPQKENTKKPAKKQADSKDVEYKNLFSNSDK